jgi:oligopeptide/dipeptide ABC transporter ATP-binding protein
MQLKSEPILSVRNLETHFAQDEGLVHAVDGASFDLIPATTLGIVGESGCGKSVTARSILQILERPGRIVSGEIRLSLGGGRTVDIAKLDPKGAEMRAVRGKEIALIFQEPMTSLSAHYTVGNQVGEAIRSHDAKASRDQIRSRTLDLLRQVGIPRPERRIDEYPFQLSGGLRQRIMIAMALACDPRILIADEPTTALDVTTQAQVLDLIRSLQKQRGLSLILITHDMGVIAEMADDVAVMYLGRIVERGPVEEIFHAPRHPYTRALLRSIPSILSRPRSRLETIEGSIPHPYNRPKGCPFHPRCTERIDLRCEEKLPSVIRIGTSSEVSCFRYEPAAAATAPSASV